ncbi:glycosyltransferase [Stutzerimonas nitrititolerans]|uniref:glycosyltransferase n=1 Tax=Stutzerimonas nitrititolerans TaxID=2482751 RepID=UPI002896C9DA|nr:glycosyltransferase [Stutzerimonas nitrititolerans]
MHKMTECFINVEVVHIIAGLSDGGAEGVLSRICLYDRSVKHSVVSLMGEGKYGAQLRANGITVDCLNMPSGRITFSGVCKLLCLLRRQRSKIVVQTWMYHADLIGGVLARLAGVRHVYWNVRHTNLDVNFSKKSTIFVARLCAWLSHLVPRQIICCAEEAAKVHRELGYASEKLLVIANGYDLSKFTVNDSARTRLRTELGLSSCWLLGMVGRFDPQKDHKNFLLALADLKRRGLSFCAILIGRGMNDSNGQLISWIKELGLEGEVRLLGQRTDIPEIMNALDVHVLSSAFGEAFPNVVAEAMACGTPVIATDVGDAGLIIGDTGWVVLPEDSSALADAIGAAATEWREAKDAWNRRKNACRTRINENFSLKKMITSYHQVWKVKKD